jgi:hypothetical protein
VYPEIDSLIFSSKLDSFDNILAPFYRSIFLIRLDLHFFGEVLLSGLVPRIPYHFFFDYSKKNADIFD